MRYCDKRRIYTHWGQTPLLLWEAFGRFLFFGLKFEKSLYNLNAMEKTLTQHQDKTKAGSRTLSNNQE